MLREVAPHVYQLEVPHSSVFFLVDDGVTLVDAGTRWSAKGILEGLSEIGHSPAELRRVLITHHHYDHWGALASLLKRGSPEVYAHEVEAAHIRGDRLPTAAAPRRPLARVLTRLLSRIIAPPGRVDRTLKGGETLPVLGGLQAVHTPGHTAGHVAYYLEECRVLLSGDAVQLSRKGRVIPPTVYEDREEAMRSLGRMAELDFEVLAPSHFPPQRDGVREELQQLVSG